MHVLVTKYTLTKGITLHRLIREDHDSAVVDAPGNPKGKITLSRGEFFGKIDDALRNARRRIDVKIDSLEKQIAELRALRNDKQKLMRNMEVV